MDSFTLVVLILQVIPLLLAANAWRIARGALIQPPAVLARIVLAMTFLSALLFSVIVLLALFEVITQSTVYWIAMPNWYLSVALLCGIRYRNTSYRPSLLPSVSLILGWLVAGIMH